MAIRTACLAFLGLVAASNAAGTQWLLDQEHARLLLPFEKTSGTEQVWTNGVELVISHSNGAQSPSVALSSPTIQSPAANPVAAPPPAQTVQAPPAKVPTAHTDKHCKNVPDPNSAAWFTVGLHAFARDSGRDPAHLKQLLKLWGEHESNAEISQQITAKAQQLPSGGSFIQRNQKSHAPDPSSAPWFQVGLHAFARDSCRSPARLKALLQAWYGHEKDHSTRQQLSNKIKMLMSTSFIQRKDDLELLERDDPDGPKWTEKELWEHLNDWEAKTKAEHAKDHPAQTGGGPKMLGGMSIAGWEQSLDDDDDDDSSRKGKMAQLQVSKKPWAKFLGKSTNHAHHWLAEAQTRADAPSTPHQIQHSAPRKTHHHALDSEAARSSRPVASFEQTDASAGSSEASSALSQANAAMARWRADSASAKKKEDDEAAAAARQEQEAQEQAAELEKAEQDGKKEGDMFAESVKTTTTTTTTTTAAKAPAVNTYEQYLPQVQAANVAPFQAPVAAPQREVATPTNGLAQAQEQFQHAQAMALTALVDAAGLQALETSRAFVGEGATQGGEGPVMTADAEHIALPQSVQETVGAQLLSVVPDTSRMVLASLSSTQSVVVLPLRSGARTNAGEWQQVQFSSTLGAQQPAPAPVFQTAAVPPSSLVSQPVPVAQAVVAPPPTPVAQAVVAPPPAPVAAPVPVPAAAPRVPAASAVAFEQSGYQALAGTSPKNWLAWKPPADDAVALGLTDKPVKKKPKINEDNFGDVKASALAKDLNDDW